MHTQASPGRPTYLDAQATTPLDPRVLDAMMPHMLHDFGNPHSRTHSYGWDSEASVEAARAQVASLIGASPKEIVFTSGATESNNLSIKGVARFYGRKKRHVITTQTEVRDGVRLSVWGRVQKHTMRGHTAPHSRRDRCCCPFFFFPRFLTPFAMS